MYCIIALIIQATPDDEVLFCSSSLSSFNQQNMSLSTSNVTVGFGTAALGGNCYHVVTMALEAGFRRFDSE
jgi:hypothetical protein